jgi:hypothetical protein
MVVSTPKLHEPALSAGNFRRIAERGFGDGCNSYAYSSVWYDNHLYIGTVRNVLPVIMMRWPFEIPFEIAPVPVPDDYTKLDLRGQIWRYNPLTREWKRIYRSPMVPGWEGRLAPVAVGFRCMTLFQGKSDARPAIYTFPIVGRNSLGAVTLRSIDGETFEALPPPRVAGEDEYFGSFRGVVAFKGRLFVAPSHTKGNPREATTQANIAPVVEVRCTDDPTTGNWHVSSPRAFGDPTNVVIFDMETCGDYLYVGVGNVREGFQLWRTNAEGDPPHRWEKVLDRGADRGQLNQAPVSFADFNGVLYLGTAIQNGGWDKTNNIGPAPAEVLRVYPDKSWDLVVGDPRMTRQGLKIPTSGMAAGFDNPLCVYMWRMCVHNGALYVGTHDLSTFTIFAKQGQWPENIRRILDRESFEQFIQYRGGCDLWRTVDGDHWQPVTRNGFDNPLNYGVRAMQSTPHGLFVGTANPFGPTLAMRSPGGWRYMDSPRGGLEVFHGALDHHEIVDHDTHTPATWLRNETTDADVAQHATSYRLRTKALQQDTRILPPTGSLADADLAFWDNGYLDPVLGLSDVPKDLLGLGTSIEHELQQYFGGDLRNAGYWRKATANPAAAAEATIVELLALFSPAEKEALARGRLLVIGQRAAAAAESVQQQTNVSKCEALELGRYSAASRSMTSSTSGNIAVKFNAAGRVKVTPSTYDALMWIEGPSQTNRRRGLRDAYRALKAGGVLLASELIGRSARDLTDYVAPDAAETKTIECYEQDLLAAGFRNVQVFDITSQGWRLFFGHSREFFLTKLLFHQIDAQRYEALLAALPGGQMAIEAHLMIVARKES